MYAVMTTGGKQYRVEAGSELVVERLSAEPGASVTFDRVLLVGDGEAITVGTPTVDGASVSATVLGETLGPKLVVFKFKQKVKYRRHAGHRQHLTRLRIDEIVAGGKPSKASKAEAKTDAPEAEAAPAAEAEKPKRARKAAPKAEAKPDAPEAEAAPADEAEKPKRTRKAAPKAESEE